MFTVIEIKSDCWPGHIVFEGDADEAGRVFLGRLGKTPDCMVAMFGDDVPLGIYGEQKKTDILGNKS